MAKVKRKSKSTTYAQDRVDAILKTNSDGTKQFGARDQFGKIAELLGLDAALSWASEHVKTTLYFRELLKRDDWCGFDSETTATGDAALPCEIGIVRPNGKVAYESLIKPLRPINDDSAAIHGITNEMVSNAPSFADEREKIQKVLSSLWAIFWYNGEFDERVTEQAAFAHGIEPLVWPKKIDIMIPVASWIGDWNPKQKGWRWAKLEGGHRSVGDVQAMIDLMIRCASSNVEYISQLGAKDVKEKK